MVLLQSSDENKFIQLKDKSTMKNDRDGCFQECIEDDGKAILTI